MNAPATIAETAPLPALVRQAADALARATSAAEVLDARDQAGLVYDAAKRAARLMKARQAHQEIIAATHRAQADALEIEAAAERRLADEYDAAQERGEVRRHGGDRVSKVSGENLAPTAAEIGLSKKDVHDARLVRDAIAQDPGIVRRALDELLADGSEPTRTALKRELGLTRRANLRAAVGTKTASAAERGNNLYETPPEATRALLALEPFGIEVWEPACGRGAISRMLEDAGHEVFLSDLVDYGTADRLGEVQRVDSFLDTSADYWLPDGPRQADIITNPPYGAALNGFVAHALRVHRPRKMALLLNLNFLCGFDDPERCFAMDENPPARILVFTRRLPMMHRDGWDGPEASSSMNTAWFVWEQDADGHYAGPPTVRRIDWKDYCNAPALEPRMHEKQEPAASTSSRTQTVEAGAAPPPAVPASAPPPLTWREPDTAGGGRILALTGEIEVGAIFPDGDGNGCGWSFWLGHMHGPHKRAKSVPAARKAFQKRWEEFCAKAGWRAAA